MGAFNNSILTSIFGRRLGLQAMSSVQSGGSGGAELLAGPDAMRQSVTTAATTGTNVKAFGTSFLPGTSAASSAVYTIDPPIPGIRATIVMNSTANGPIYLKTANGETFISTQGTTFSIIKSTNNTVGAIDLLGLTTAIWGIPSGIGLSSASFALTTTT